MPEKWTGELIGKMHNQRVTINDLASVLGCTNAYVSMILNGRRKPGGAREKLEAAFFTVIARRGRKEERNAKSAD